MSESENSEITRRKFAVVAGTTVLAAAMATNTASAATEGADSDASTDKVAKLPPFPQQVLSLYGYRVVTVIDKKGKKTKVWMAATADDYRTMKAKRLGKEEKDIDVPRIIEKDGEFVLDVDSCAIGSAGFCFGTCTNGTCVQSVSDGYITCVCSKS